MTDVYSIIVKFFQEGGFFLYPISLVFIVGLAIALERWVYLGREKSRNTKAFNDFLPLLRTTDMEKMQMYTRENTAPVVRIVGCGLDMMKVSRQRADVENSMSEGMLEAMPRLETRTSYLAVLANVATLLGLLGTIIGLIGAFTAVANADPAEKSQLLSSSISVAMNTTAFGLIAAIPLLILNAILQNKTKTIVTGIEMSAVKFLNIMTLHRFIEAGTPRIIAAEPGPNPFAAPKEAAKPEPMSEDEIAVGQIRAKIARNQMAKEMAAAEVAPEISDVTSSVAEESVEEVALVDQKKDDPIESPDLSEKEKNDSALSDGTLAPAAS